MQGFLHLLSDPNIAFILFALGFYGLLFELIHPNFVTGILGGLALILAFIGSGSLPLNVAGVLLLGLAVLLLFLEATVPSPGLLTIGGLVCFVLGASTFYTTPGPGFPNAQVSWPVVAVMAGLGVVFSRVVGRAGGRSRRFKPTAGGTGHTVGGPRPGGGVVFALVVLRAAVLSRRMKPTAVSPGLSFGGTGTVGVVGEVRHALDPEGSVYVAGEEWSARSAIAAPIPRGTRVRVVAQDGLVLVVEPMTADQSAVAPARS